jgi:hypothetical protein
MSIANQTHYRIIGNTDIEQLADKRVWNRTDGVQKLQRFVGTADAINAKFNELSAGGTVADDMDETVEGQYGQLLVRINEDSGSTEGANSFANNGTWELLAMEVMKPIESHYWFDSITAARKREIERCARDATSISGTPTDAENYLFAYYANQILEYPIDYLELRQTLIVSNRSTLTATHTGNNRVVTLASIDPPDALLGTLTSLPKGDGTSGAWEWMKKAPQVIQVAKSKFQIQYRWLGAERWAAIYGGSWLPVT